MPVIRISDATWERLKAHARPFEDKPEDVVNLALDALDEKLGQKPPVIQKTTAEKPATTTKRLAQSKFRIPLMKTVLDLGGSAEVSAIRKAMEEKMAPLLRQGDYETVATGEPRWWNAIVWERNALVKEGLFSKTSKRGVWELTEEGKALLR